MCPPRLLVSAVCGLISDVCGFTLRKQLAHRILTVRAGNRRFSPLSALRARTKAPCKMDFHGENAKEREGRLTAPRGRADRKSTAARSTWGPAASPRQKQRHAESRISD